MKAEKRRLRGWKEEEAICKLASVPSLAIKMGTVIFRDSANDPRKRGLNPMEIPWSTFLLDEMEVVS